MGANPGKISKGGRTEAERRELQRRALELRGKNMRYDEIGQELGISAKRASMYVKQLQEKLSLETLDEYRDTVDSRLDGLARKLHEMLEDPDITPAQKRHVIRDLAAIEDQRARLMGLNLPVKQMHQFLDNYDGENEHAD